MDRTTHRRRIVWRAAAAITVVGVTLAACGGDAAAPSQGTLALALTDAPFPYDSVARADLFVVRIDGKLADADEADATAGTDDQQSNTDPSKGWVTLATPNASINLLDLQAGRTLNLGQQTLPTGSYRGFRLILDTDHSTITLKNGTVLTGSSTPGIRWPSAGRTGIKVKLDRPIALTEIGSQMVLDFDLGNSFVLRGSTISANGLLFKPVIRGEARDITGTLSGTVHAGNASGPAVADAAVEVLPAGTAITDTDPGHVIATTRSDTSGAFTAAFLMPGTYAVRVTPPATSSATRALVDGIVVSSGTTASVSAVLPLRP